jgi:hypothetical protein
MNKSNMGNVSFVNSKSIINKRGQVWVETVIYTLIGLAIIGLVLGSALPKINEKKDSIAIEQSIDVLRAIDGKIFDVQSAVGNRRVIDLDIRKGALVIDSGLDKISWVLDSSFAYSEVDLPVSLGRIDVTTVEKNPFEVTLSSVYDVDIRFDGETTGEKTLNAAPIPYVFVVENSGISGDDRIIITLMAT